MLHCRIPVFSVRISCHFIYFPRDREPELFPDDDDPFDDLEADDFDELPDLEPEADFLAAELPERLLEERLEPLFDEDDLEPLLFDEDERELPLFDEEDREPPVLEVDEPLFEEEPFADELFDEEPEDFRLEDPDEPLRDEPEDLLLVPLEDFPLDDFDEPLFEDDPDRPPELLPLDDEPLELLRDEDPFDDDERAELVPPPLLPPVDELPCAPAASADCTTVAAPSTAPIAAAVAMLPAASAAFASKPLLPLLREDLFEDDDVLFFDFDLVVAI